MASFVCAAVLAHLARLAPCLPRRLAEIALCIAADSLQLASRSMPLLEEPCPRLPVVANAALPRVACAFVPPGAFFTHSAGVLSFPSPRSVRATTLPLQAFDALFLDEVLFRMASQSMTFPPPNSQKQVTAEIVSALKWLQVERAKYPQLLSPFNPRHGHVRCQRVVSLLHGYVHDCAVDCCYPLRPVRCQRERRAQGQLSARHAKLWFLAFPIEEPRTSNWRNGQDAVFLYAIDAPCLARAELHVHGRWHFRPITHMPVRTRHLAFVARVRPATHSPRAAAKHASFAVQVVSR